MNHSSESFVLRGGHVLDAEQGIDAVMDVHVENGKIQHVGARETAPGARIIDASGCYVSAGWVDIHVHAYGTLGFSNPDSIGVYQGVTSFVDAGGPGIGVLDQFKELVAVTETSLYAGGFIRPMGLLGLNFIEGDVRTLGNVPITEWVDYARENRDMLRYIKCNAIGDYGPGSLKLTKGLAEILDRPLYMHIGEFQMQTPDHLLAYDAFRVAQAGDMIAHLYHGNLGQVLDDEGKVYPVVRDAERRGVLFDLGFGGYNFKWSVADKAYAQDLVPHTISTDLQQFNVVRPVKSLANVMTSMFCLGMKLPQIVERVTRNAARAIRLDDRAGSLKPGLPADITVFRVNSGEFKIDDCYGDHRMSEQEIEPLFCFKAGKRYDSNMTMAQAEDNWFLQIAEDHIPERAARLNGTQRDFLAAMAGHLAATSWDVPSADQLDIDKALVLQDTFHKERKLHQLPLKDALEAFYASFLDQKFTMQVGLLLLRMEQPFVLERLHAVSSKEALAA